MKGPKQQRISDMFGERVTKPRLSSLSSSLIHKPSNPDVTLPEKAKSLLPPSIPIATVPKPMEIVKQKKKWRLAEIVKRERESREARCRPQPSFVFEAPHMDTRRPSTEDRLHTNETATKLGNPPVKPPRVPQKRPREECTTTPIENKRICVHRQSPSITKSQPRTSVKISGGEAILYDRSMLPSGHSLLLDVLSGLELALSLLRTRKSIPTIAAVREIVTRSTRRTFTLRMLSQLAHLVPEAVAVIPGIGGPKFKDRPSEGLVIRLDDVDMTHGEAGAARSADSSLTGSCLGDAAARVRRSLLHKRLLKHVQSEHSRFLEREGLGRHLGYTWHPKFNLEQDVGELPCPPLYPVQLKQSDELENCRPVDSMKREKVTVAPHTEKIPTPPSESADAKSDADSDGCIPQSLLDRVRQRAMTKEVRVATAEDNKANNRSLLTKLPCTMDSISSILRGDRRTAMGWAQLINKLAVVHPKKWTKQDLEEQLDVITQIGSDWCKKIALKSSRGGFAFRVVSDAQFSAARAKVASTESFQIADKL